MPGRDVSSEGRRRRARLAPVDWLRTVNDDALLADVAAGYESALAELYDRHGAAVFALSKRMLGDAGAGAEVLEEVFVELWEHPRAFDPRLGPLRYHLLGLARGLCLERLEGERPDVGREASLGSTDEDLHIVELVFFNGYTCRELAEHLGLPEQEVNRRIRFGLRRLGQSPAG